ncbi:MAG TPA: zinc-binding dehydrogenase [Planctomycetota bacterium]|nr:zinc-binding dehydrogenase [Planctomycetota bacterium]
MRALRIAAHGGLDALQVVDIEEPELGPGEVRVAMAAVALNHLDVWVRRGVPGHVFPLPIVPCSDGAGRVVEVGAAVRGLSVGDEVFVLPGVSDPRGEATLRGEDQLDPSYEILGEARDGLACERVVLPQENVHRKPQRLSLVEAAAFPLSFLTAWNMVVRRACVQPGETVLVQAAASGVGVAVVEICHLIGARVIATAGSADKCARLEGLGVLRAIRYDEEDVVTALREVAPGGVEVVVDHVGKATFDASLRCLRRAGRYVTCGATTGTSVGVHLGHVFFKSLSILGSTMGRRGDLLQIARLMDQGRLSPVVGAVLQGLEAVREGHRLLEDRSVFGKVVIEH